jgi:tetratricopeptide (TPR) repeat protein|tara:strand:- start:457 stop:1137 length:681 start_codon:yes stop_codon:yes gene_type:complete
MKEKNNHDNSLKSAFEEVRAGNFQKAIAIYDDILGQNPDHPDALVNKSITLMSSKRFDESLLCLNPISYESPHGFDKMLIEANCFYNLGQTAEAEKLYNKISNVLPINKKVILQIGSKCLEQGFFRIAIEIFSKLEDKQDKFERNYYMGLSYKGLGELTNSIRAFGRALRAKPDFYQLYPLTAATCFQNNMIDEGDKIMNILKEEHSALFQHVAGVVSSYRISNEG